MPLASYDYDYYEYVNGRRTNKTTYAAQTTSKRSNAKATSKTTTTSQTKKSQASTRISKTSNATRPQTRKNVNAAVKRTSATTKKATPKTANAKNTRTAVTKKTTTKKLTKATKKYDIDIPLKSSSKIVNKPKEMTLKKPKAKVNAALAFKQALTRTFGVAALFAIAFAICYRYSLMNEEFIELRNIKKEYETIQNVNEQLEADIESKTDLTYIENYAKYQLGMQKPSDSQLKYVNIEKRDRVLTPVTIEEETDTNWFTKICEEVRKLLD